VAEVELLGSLVFFHRSLLLTAIFLLGCAVVSRYTQANLAIDVGGLGVLLRTVGVSSALASFFLPPPLLDHRNLLQNLLVDRQLLLRRPLHQADRLLQAVVDALAGMEPFDGSRRVRQVVDIQVVLQVGEPAVLLFFVEGERRLGVLLQAR